MDYAIIRLGNKQHVVRDGETLVVDRLPAGEGESFQPVVVLGEGPVTATVVAHGRGPKLVIGKYRRRTGYKRHNGFRAATSQVEIALGATGKTRAGKQARAPKKPAEPAVEAAEPTVEADEPAVEAATPAVGVAPAEAEATPPAGLPAGYEGMTVAQVSAGAKDWSLDELEAALAHERAQAARKGALAALEAAITRERGDGA
jgi:large subunit ribosomal protein L21